MLSSVYLSVARPSCLALASTPHRSCVYFCGVAQWMADGVTGLIWTPVRLSLALSRSVFVSGFGAARRQARHWADCRVVDVAGSVRLATTTTSALNQV